MNKSQQGSSIIEVLIIIFVIIAIGTIGLFVLKNKDSNNNSSKDNTNQNTSKDDTPKLMNLGIKSLDSIDVSMNSLRDFNNSGHKGLYIFGDKLPGTPVRLNPNFEFASLKEDTEIVSAIDGEVVFIQEQKDSKDYEVFISTNSNSQWVIGYDHVINLKVNKGDTVKTSQLIGNPARQNNGLLRFEIQINKGKNDSDTKHICPITLLDSSVKDSITAKLSSIQTSWEQLSGYELYDTSSQNPIGCLYKELTPAQAQGTAN